MAVIPKLQAETTEDKLDKILQILGKMPNRLESDFLRGFILELCERYCNKINEFKKLGFLTPSVEKMEDFEKEYMERIINEFKYVR